MSCCADLSPVADGSTSAVAVPQHPAGAGVPAAHLAAALGVRVPAQERRLPHASHCSALQVQWQPLQGREKNKAGSHPFEKGLISLLIGMWSSAVLMCYNESHFALQGRILYVDSVTRRCRITCCSLLFQTQSKFDRESDDTV